MIAPKVLFWENCIFVYVFISKCLQHVMFTFLLWVWHMWIPFFILFPSCPSPLPPFWIHFPLLFPFFRTRPLSNTRKCFYVLMYIYFWRTSEMHSALHVHCRYCLLSLSSAIFYNMGTLLHVAKRRLPFRISTHFMLLSHGESTYC